MHDIKSIRDNPTRFNDLLSARNHERIAHVILDLDAKHRALVTLIQEKEAKINQLTGQIAKEKKNGRDPKDLISQSLELRKEIDILQVDMEDYKLRLNALLESIPNLPADDVPIGTDETYNQLCYTWGSINEQKAGLEHWVIAERLGGYEPEIASKMSGSRFTILTGALARLERALGQFMIDFHVKNHFYTEVSPPLLVRNNALYGTGQLPKFEQDLFRTEGHYLIPTAEVPLTNMFRETIITKAKLPIRLTALTPCFRSEAGAAGKDSRGLIRQHQFWKTELVSICEPDLSPIEHAAMLDHATKILQMLELPYRVMTLCTGDMGFSARKTYDIEVWMPGQKTYREISSVSNCGDFQARRMGTKFKNPETKKNEYVHTLNGSGVAVGRCLAAILENHVQNDFSVKLPKCLHPYMGDCQILKPIN